MNDPNMPESDHDFLLLTEGEKRINSIRETEKERQIVYYKFNCIR
jgi:hypothetical protein